MKIKITILLLSAFMICNAQSFKNASEYLNFVGKEHTAISKSMWSYTKAVAHSKKDRTIRGKRSVLIKTVQRAILKIQKANGFDGDDYKNKVLKQLDFNLNLLNHDYAKIIDMKEVAEQSYDLMEAYMLAQELADKKMEEAQQQYEIDFHAYAKKHNINIIESDTDLGKKMKISNEVFKHYNEMYLTYFKVYINEVYLLKAMEKSDIGTIEQSANALSETANAGLEKLSTLKTYKGDKSIIYITKDFFEFYKDEAENKVPKLIDFLLLNENFATIKNTLDKTPERKRTKKQIDNYNEQVKLLNKGVKDYNKTNTELNKKRTVLFNKLNGANERFLAKHIPKE
ncbi:hypothetical protein DIS18_08515 [Algibacter marinivivus]|uniref:Uncharacterized protein n=1 Tax=Algibacter marinivivus TaxID=2100723 RepID=A0A2U2X3D4_9FLAO|nr:hypothetical protein [Algibacter marinivivus]PWH82291.1 hypothetical protein DIS18_08515 [Algibacter marinivivus]